MFKSKNNILRRTASLALAASMVLQSVTPYYASEPATEVATEAPATEAQTQPETPVPQPETPAPQPETPAPQPETPAPQPETAAPQPETTPAAPAPETKVEAPAEAPATEKQTEKVTEKATEKQTEKATEKQTEAPKYTLTLPVLEEVSYDYDKDHKDDKASNDKKVVLVYLEDEKVEFSITTEDYTYTIIEDRDDDQENTIKSYEDVKNRNEAKATYEFKMPAKDLIIKYVEIPEEETEVETDTEKKIETQELTESQGTEEATEAVSEETESEVVTEEATEANTEDAFVESNENALTETEAISEETEAISEETETESLTEETEAETEAITEVPTEETTESETEEEQPEGTFAVYMVDEENSGFTSSTTQDFYYPGDTVNVEYEAESEVTFTNSEPEENQVQLRLMNIVSMDTLEVLDTVEIGDPDETTAESSFTMPEEDVVVITEFLGKTATFTKEDGTADGNISITKGFIKKGSTKGSGGSTYNNCGTGGHGGGDSLKLINVDDGGSSVYWVKCKSMNISSWTLCYCIQPSNSGPNLTEGAKEITSTKVTADILAKMLAVYYFGTKQASGDNCYFEQKASTATNAKKWTKIASLVVNYHKADGGSANLTAQYMITHVALSYLYHNDSKTDGHYTNAPNWAVVKGLLDYAEDHMDEIPDGFAGHIIDTGKITEDGKKKQLQDIFVGEGFTSPGFIQILKQLSPAPPASNPNYTLAGASFDIYELDVNEDTDAVVQGAFLTTVTTDATGYTRVLGEADGIVGGDSYRIYETAAPANSEMPQNPYYQDIEVPEGTTETAPFVTTFTNTPKMMAVRFAKEAATPQNDIYIYKDAVYSVKGASEAQGRNVTTVQTATAYDGISYNGYAEVRDLWIDDYTITEISPAINFDTNATPVAYWPVADDGTGWNITAWKNAGLTQDTGLGKVLRLGTNRGVYEPEKWVQLGIQKINKREGTNRSETGDYSLAGATYKVYKITKQCYETHSVDPNFIVNYTGTKDACYYYDTNGTQGKKTVSQTPIYITTNANGYAETAGEADTNHRLERDYYALIEVETSTNMLMGTATMIDAHVEDTANTSPSFVHCGRTPVGEGQAPASGEGIVSDGERYTQFFIQKIDWMSNLARNPIAADFTSKIWTKDGDQNGIVENDNYSLENAVFDVYKVPFGQEDAWLNNANFFKECDQATAASFRAQAQGLPKAYYYADNNPNPTSEAVVLTTNAKGQAHTKYDASHRLLCGVYVIVEREDSMNYTLGAPVIIDARRETEKTSPEHNVEQPLNNPDSSDASVPQLRLYKAWGEEGATESTDGAVPTGQFPESGYNTYTVAPIRQYPRPVQLKIQKVDKRTKLASVPVDNGEYSLANAKFRVYAIKPDVLPRGDGKGSDENLTEAILKQIASPAHYITDKGEDNGEVIITTDANGVAQTLDDPNHRLLAGCYAICEFEESKGFRLGKIVTIDARRENFGGAGNGDASSGQEGTNKTGTRLYGPQTPQGKLYVKGTQGKYEIPAVYEPERWGYIHLIKYDGDSKTKQQYFGYSNYGSYAHSQSGSNIEPSQGNGRDANVNERSGIFVEYEQGTPQYLSTAGATYIASFGNGFGDLSGTTAKSIDQLPNTDEYLDRLTNDGFLVYPAPYFVIGGKTVGINKAVQAHTKMESYEQTGETTLVTNEDGRIDDGITVKAKDTIGPLLLGTYTVVETDINEANNFEDARSLGVTDESLMNNPNGTRSSSTAPEDTTGGWNAWSAKIPQTTLDINSIPQHNLNITHKKDTNTYTIHTESLYLPNDDESRGREDVRHDVDTTSKAAINDGVEVNAPKNKDNTAVVESTDWEKTGEIEIYKLFERRRDNAIRNDDYKIGENLNPVWGNEGDTDPKDDYVGNYKDSSFAEESLIKEGTFSLAGAIIGIYHTKADAEAAQNYWTTSHNGVNPLNTAGFSGIHDAVMGKYNCEACLITDEHGYAISDMNFLFDDYYVVELRAPECGAYEVDPEIHQVTLNVATPYRESAKERIATVELLEQPHLGKFQFQKMLEDAVEYADGSTTDKYGLNDSHIRQLISDKWWYYDQDTGARQPIKFFYYHIGDASKVGANFIHKGVTQVAGNNPTVVINHCARSDGDPRYRYNEKADGSPVSLTAEGLLYGNWYVYEDPATVPDGYQPLTFKIHIEEDRSYIYELNGETYDFDKDQTENEGDEIPSGAKIDDNVKFKLKIHKIDAHTGQEVSLDNAQFQLYENRFNDIYDTDTDDGPAHWIVDDGSANGKVTTTLTTGEDGTVTIVGQCRQDEAGNWVRMSGTPDDPRIYSAGHYTLKEVKTPWHYYTLTSPVQFSILYDKQYVSDDGNEVAGLDYVIAPTSGAYMTIEPDGTEVLNLQLFVKDEPVLGRLKVEKFCAYGGEQVNMEGFEFDIVCAENITDERATASDPHATAYENPTENDYTYTQTSGGSVTPNDTVANNGDKVGVDGSKYRVDLQTGRILKKGAVADHIVTDANGVAVTKDLYLGKYWVRETKSGQYFALDLANSAALTVAKTDDSGNATNYNVVDEDALSDYFVELEEDDVYKDGSFVPKTYFAEETYQFYNYPTTLKIGKLDIVATTRQGKEVYLPGATFHIWSEDGVDDWTMTTGPDGFFQMDHDHDHVDDNGKEIPGFRHGAVYHVKETKAPAGYYEDKNEYVFTVNNDGYYEDGTLTTGGQEAQTSRSLDPTTDANPEAGNDDAITDKNREIQTLYAKDIAEVARDPKDHGINLRYTLQFIVKDNPQNIYITKSDITDAKRVDDAKLKVIYGDKSGNGVAEGHTAGEVLDEWVTAKSQDAYNENEKLTNSDFFKDRHEIYAVPDGWYTLIEVTAPYGYEMAESISFEVVHGMARTYEKMEDKPFRRVFIDKLDMVDGESIAGATLELYADKDIKDVEGNVLVEAGTLIERWVSGENIGLVDNFGEFYNAQGINPPQENLNPVDTSLWEADEDYQEWVSYDKTSTVKSVPHMIALHSGDYKLVEILPPVGYSSMMDVDGEEVRNEVVFTVKETGNGDFDIHKVAMNDERLKLYITKSDITTSAPVPGAQLTIKSQDGKIIDQWITGIKPHYIERIPVGKYTLTETRTPTDRGYVTAETVEFEVTDTTKIQTVDMKDDYTKVQLTKSDITTSEPVIGAELVIKDEAGNEIERWITEVEPHYIERLPVGKYTLTETRTPTDQGYITAETVEFDVSDTGLIQKVDMKDDFTKVKITKSDITNSKLVNGATLVIKDEKGKVIDKWVTDDKPHYIERIPVGKYTLTEITAPDGYEVAETVEFEVDETGEIQLVEMKDAPYRSVDITKTDITNSEEIVGAILVIRDLDGNLVDAWISGQPGGDSNNGAYYGGDTESTPRPESDITNLEGVDITGLKPGPHRVNLHSGKYTLSEYKPADGYTTAETIEFEVLKVTDTDYEVMGLNMTDDVTKVEITKADITDSNPVIGAELIIKDEKGNVVDTWITEETPHYIEKLPIGKYTLTEITAPDGYEVAETVEFEVKDTGEIQKVFMYDSPYRSVDITKTDITNGEEIPGACLVIRDKDGKLVDAWISGQPGSEDNNGAYYGGDTKSEPKDEEIIEELVKTVDVNDLHAQPHRVNLHSGTYTLSEYKPADGYVTAETITFEVIKTSETDYKVMGVEMKDDVTKVEITKADITDSKPVIGAVLIIEDANDNEIARWVTEKEPHYIEKLPIGKYKLTEITAPQGYNVAETVEFEVLDTGEIQHVFMYDSPTVKTPIPKMGDLLNRRNLIIGGVAILILLILVLLLLKGRKTPKKDDPDDGASEDTAESKDASDEASSEENSSPEE